MSSLNRRPKRRSLTASKARSKSADPVLSAGEEQLLQQAMKGVRPISNDRVEPHRRVRKARPGKPRIGSNSTSSEDTAGLQILHAEQLADSHANLAGHFLEWCEHGVSSRTMRDLRRGNFRPQASLDLHGLTLEHASNRFSAFVKHCGSERIRTSIIVHGKGFGSNSGVPVLKSNVERWLTQHSQVIAFCSALPRDGGTGAVYVLIRGDGPLIRTNSGRTSGGRR